MGNGNKMSCVCGHGIGEHGFSGMCHSCLPCYKFLSTFDYEQQVLEDQKKAETKAAREEARTQFVARNRCPKCGKSSSPSISHHPNVPWYKFNRCKLGLKTEHIHLVCDMCNAHYSVKCLDDIVNKMGANRD